MPECASCSAELKPEWKYCIYCGTPVVPGAIRPEPVERPRISTLAVVIYVLVLVAAVLGLVWLATWIFSGGIPLSNAL
ncbi:MAG: hypothetical protein JWP85_1832 [Rhodoglobus sp.]|nr:hypothetical protein [Rhodoglobus sp.]